MGNDFSQKLNERARATGKTHAELADEVRDALFGEPTGIRKWVERVRNAWRRPTDIDRENRRLFEENLVNSDLELRARLEAAQTAKGESQAPSGGFKER